MLCCVVLCCVVLCCVVLCCVVLCCVVLCCVGYEDALWQYYCCNISCSPSYVVFELCWRFLVLN
jgi:hypothetical protein